MKTYSKNCKTRKPDGMKKEKKAYGGMTGKAKTPMKKAMGGMTDMGESMYQGMKMDAAQKMMKADGGKLKMVEKDGKKVPFYAADGKGKMMYGGMAKKKK